MGKAAVAAATLPLASDGITASANAQSKFVVNRFALEINGKFAGFLQSYSGGVPTVEVTDRDFGPNDITNKSLRNVRYHPILLKFSNAMSAEFLSKLSSSFSGASEPTTLDGAISVADANGNAQSRLEFRDALPTKIIFPASDPTSKDPAYFTVELQPQFVRSAKPTKLQIPQTSSQKWIAGNFTFTCDGIDSKGIAKIDSFCIRRNYFEEFNHLNKYFVIPANLEVSDIIVTVVASQISKWQSWFDRHLVDGKLESEYERQATLSYLSADLKSVIGSVQLTNLGIYEIAHEKIDATTSNPLRQTVSMYCEQISFKMST